MYISLIKTTPITICYFLILINKIAALRSYLKEVLEFYTQKKSSKKLWKFIQKERKRNINVFETIEY